MFLLLSLVVWSNPIYATEKNSSTVLEDPCDRVSIRAKSIEIKDEYWDGAKNGSIYLNVYGGTVPYSYKWTGPDGYTSTSLYIKELSAGKYTLEVYDQNGCRAFFTYYVRLKELIMPKRCVGPSIRSKVVEIRNEYGEGALNGMIDVDIYGGKPPYRYYWVGSNGYVSNTEDAEGIGAGRYYLKVYDANGCRGFFTYYVSLKHSSCLGLELRSQLDEVKSARGPHAKDGAIYITMKTGQAPYEYKWTGPNGFQSDKEDIRGLAPGKYVLEVYDANGCRGYYTYYVRGGKGGDMECMMSVDTRVRTVKAPGGKAIDYVDIEVKGGTPPYTFRCLGLSPGFDGRAWSMDVGVYPFEVTDAKGCLSIVDINIRPGQRRRRDCEGAEIRVSVEKRINQQGIEINDVDFVVNGGSPPYKFIPIQPVDFTELVDQGIIPEGRYIIDSYDRDGCRCYAFINIIKKRRCRDVNIRARESIRPASSETASDGAIYVDVSGGKPPYDYEWEGEDGFTSKDKNITNVKAGDYKLTVYDDNGCSEMFEYEVPVNRRRGARLVAGLQDMNSMLHFYPNPSTGILNLDIPSYAKSIELSVFDMTGKMVLTQQVDSPQKMILDLKGHEKGLYMLKAVIDGETSIQKFMLE